MAQIRKTVQPTRATTDIGFVSVHYRPTTAPRYVQPELELDRTIIVKDLIQTIGVTVLLVAAQVAGWMYLQRGGWNLILGLFR